MPPKKRRPLVWLPLSWKALVTTTGEFKEYYLPLSNEEIEKDLLHLSALLAQMGASKRVRRPAAHLQGAAPGEASSEEYSPSSQQGEEENESGNPSGQQQWMGHAPPAPAAPQQQHQAALA